MSIIRNASDLNLAIQELENLRIEQDKNFKSQVQGIYERSKPINVIRNTLQKVSNSNSIQATIITSGLSLVSSYFTERLIMSESTSKSKKLLGSAAMLLVSSYLHIDENRLSKLKTSIGNLFHAYNNNNIKS